ncbi:diguanylate cyclase (GGDEF)-like protein [Vreelandella songnenensis]|uniref:diguanylate cyclase n=1 Tax=Vreelandella songnenensis TaxID=1176243 RepID=A0A2T0V953_9GAMM|nr:diguanylate cyclase [Halomonas songnenensis]PRY66706.1 diguanylate cyclase (GGDEF)-like protein [Halomonas songnenensis]
MHRLSYYYQQLSQPADETSSVRDQYDRDRHDERLHSLKRVCGWLALFYFTYTLVDIYLIPDVSMRSFALRFGLVGPSTLLLFAYFKRPVSIRRKELAAVCQGCLGALVWCMILISTQTPDVLNYYYAGLVFILVLTIVATPPFEQSLYGTLLVFAALYTTIWFLPGATMHYVLLHLSVGIPVTLLSLMANYRFSAESLRLYLEKLSVDQLRRELAQRNRELEKLSLIDPLTGLANRRALTNRISQLTDQAGAPSEMAVVIIDVDHFKAFNDFYGHSEGDNCLCAVAGAIRTACGTNDLICRYGGEEFLVLHITPFSPAANARALAESIRGRIDCLAMPHQPTQKGHVTVSVGVCSGLLSDASQLNTLIEHADEALYQAKRKGRNRVEESAYSILMTTQNLRAATCKE